MKHAVLSCLTVLLVSPSLAVVVGQQPAAAQDLRFAVAPRKVVVNQAYENLAWSLKGSDVSVVESVNATLEHVATREAVDFDYAYASDGPLAGTFRFYDWNRPGRYVVYGPAYDVDFKELVVAPTYVTAKFDARSRLSATRSGSNVTLRAVTKRYTGGYPLWEGHRKSTVRYERFAKGEWRTIATRTVPRNGVTEATVSKAVVSRYRVVVDATRKVWGDVSAVVRR